MGGITSLNPSSLPTSDSRCALVALVVPRSARVLGYAVLVHTVERNIATVYCPLPHGTDTDTEDDEPCQLHEEVSRDDECLRCFHRENVPK
jgi:hypothetical protein